MIEDVSPQTISDFPMAENDLRLAIEAHDIGLLRSLQICFPACVYSYNRKSHIAEVMPLVKQAFYNGEWHFIRRKPFEVAVRNIQCGGFTIDYPVYVGDTGWVFSSDRDTLLLKEPGAVTNSVLEGDRPIPIIEEEYQQNPHQPLLHSFTRGFFIPDNWGRCEAHRYKDNSAWSIDSGLYIGASFDTNDKRDDDGDKIYQKGNSYEQHASSSIVVKKFGGAGIASSSSIEPTEEEKKAWKGNPYISVPITKSHVQVEKGKAEIFASYALDIKKPEKEENEDNEEVDEDEKRATYKKLQEVKEEEEKAIKRAKAFARQEWRDTIATIDERSFEIRNLGGSDYDDGFLCHLDKSSFTLKVDGIRFHYSQRDGLSLSIDGDVNLRVAGATNIMGTGALNITNEGSINLNAVDGGLRVNADSNIELNGNYTHIVARNSTSLQCDAGCSIISKGAVSVLSANSVGISAATSVELTGGNNVCINGGKSVWVVAPQEVAVSAAEKIDIVAQQPDATLNIRTLSLGAHILLTTEGDNSRIRMYGQGKDNEISLSAPVVSIGGEKVSISGEYGVYVNAGAELWLHSDSSAELKGDQKVTVGKRNSNFILQTPEELKAQNDKEWEDFQKEMEKDE